MRHVHLDYRLLYYLYSFIIYIEMYMVIRIFCVRYIHMYIHNLYKDVCIRIGVLNCTLHTHTRTYIKSICRVLRERLHEPCKGSTVVGRSVVGSVCLQG